jgi:hypothetical protein
VEITAFWLTGALLQGGGLVEGRVRSFDVESFTSNHGSNARLTLGYEPGSSGDLPERLFLKVCTREEFGSSEVDFYRRDYSGFGGPPVVRCFSAEYQHAPRQYHVLLEDLSATHEDQGGALPSRSYALAFADAAARFHAHWWGVDRFGEAGHACPDVAALERFVAVCSIGFPDLLRELEADDGELLETEWESLADRFRQRRGEQGHLTLVHGDLNPTNILARGPVAAICQSTLWTVSRSIGA